MSFVKTREVRTKEEASKPELYVTPCNICRKTTQNTVLSDHGGMCFQCFKDYCAGARQNRIGLKTNEDRA